MSEQDIKKTLAEHDKRIEQVEAALGQVQPQKLDPQFEAEQESHQAAIESFNRDKMGHSLNSALTPEQTAEMPRKLDDDEKGDQKPNA